MVVKFHSKEYKYQVFRSEEVSNKDFTILEETKDEVLTLSTCWPPGTLEKRYVVQAKRE